MLMNIPWGLCHQCPCPHSEPQAALASSGYPPRLTGRSGPGSYGVTALPWVPVHMKPCVHPPRVESVFPPVLWSSCTQAPLAFKAKCSGGSSSQCQTPRLGEPDVGFRTLTPVGEPLQYNYFPVCMSSTWHVWDLIVSQKCPSYHLVVASSLSLDVEYLFWQFPIFFCRWLFSSQL